MPCFSPIDKFSRLCLFFISTSTSLNLVAGELTLDNGDVIHGELVALHENHIVWSSNVFGEIEIPKENIKEVNSSSVLPVVKTITTTASDGDIQLEERTNCSFQLDKKTSVVCDTGEWQGLTLNDVISVPLAPKPDPFVGDIKFGINKKSGNTNSEEVDIGLSTQYRQGKFLHEAGLVIESDSSEGEVTDEQYKGNYQINYDLNGDNPDDSWFSYGRIKYENTRFSAIEEQYQIGAGLGRRLHFPNQLKLNMQLGGTYLSTKRAEDSSDDKNLAGRWALNLDWSIPGSELTLFHRQELLWVMDDINNNEVETSTGIKVPLLGGIFSEIRYDMDYVSEPTEDQSHADEEWVISLGYQW
jgi:putative salt-induced outer membrane protein YdiY